MIDSVVDQKEEVEEMVKVISEEVILHKDPFTFEK